MSGGPGASPWDTLDVQDEAALMWLRDLAAKSPVDVRGLVERLEDPTEKARHMERMGKQTLELPCGVMVTFAIENGHPIGACRHATISFHGDAVNPATDYLWEVCRALGFDRDWGACHLWAEELRGHGLSLGVLQSMTVPLWTGGEG